MAIFIEVAVGIMITLLVRIAAVTAAVSVTRGNVALLVSVAIWVRRRRAVGSKIFVRGRATRARGGVAVCVAVAAGVIAIRVVVAAGVVVAIGVPVAIVVIVASGVPVARLVPVAT